ncbi:SusD/RagB family nutrient-binding outer membrane lipoprotein [Capnocytophaga stomatis]|uniref:SusD/RagB family nutrient-binding outer membrane lipoprotein n=1 Tax=Capnocytophaga stomatis TaxID=1848904 RepID=UPI00385B71F4
MKIVHKNIFLAGLAIVMSTSCIKDFEDVNTNQLYPTDEQAEKDGLSSGGLFPNLMQRPIPTGTGVNPANDYQVVQNMSTDNWVGYFSPGRNHWDSGRNQTSYYVSDGRANGTFNTLIGTLMNQFFRIKTALHTVEVVDGKLIFKEKDELSKTAYAVAQITKIMGIHRATDLFGPIPYTDMEPGKQQAKYDSQETVYRTFLAELDAAVSQLTSYGVNNKILEEYDPVYQGSVAKWVKLGNSLMLRLAMRVRYADEALAKTYITKATSHSGGLIQLVDESAKLASNGKYILNNSLVTMKGYGELKMGATIYSYLKGYNDPRIEKYFTKGKSTSEEDLSDDYYAVRSGIDPTTGTGKYQNYSEPTVILDTPTYWLRASEVYFLLAEAALAEYISGSAEGYYKKGVQVSFEENGLSASEADKYLATSGKPAFYKDPKDANYNTFAVSSIDKKWDDTASDEEKLERIITQKYLAIYPNGFEAWSEWRRTGYPRMFKVPFNLTNKGARDVTDNGKDYGVRRFPFPQNEFENNNANVSAARALLGGADNAATNVWWDKKSKQ